MIKKRLFFLTLMICLSTSLILFGEETDVTQGGYIINVSVSSWADYPISYSGDYSGEGITPITIGPYDEPFTVILNITKNSCASGMCVELNSWSKNGEYNLGKENIITVSTTPDIPVIDLVALYSTVTPPPKLTDEPTPVSTPNYHLGDVNHDLKINIVDALLVAGQYVGIIPNKNCDPFLADVNCDSRITIVDALLIAHFYVGLIDVFCPLLAD